jgi:hypothetical protein
MNWIRICSGDGEVFAENGSCDELGAAPFIGEGVRSGWKLLTEKSV